MKNNIYIQLKQELVFRGTTNYPKLAPSFAYHVSKGKIVLLTD